MLPGFNYRFKIICPIKVHFGLKPGQRKRILYYSVSCTPRPTLFLLIQFLQVHLEWYILWIDLIEGTRQLLYCYPHLPEEEINNSARTVVPKSFRKYDPVIIKIGFNGFVVPWRTFQTQIVACCFPIHLPKLEFYHYNNL